MLPRRDMEALQERVRASPQSSDLLFALAEALQRLDRQKEAAKAYRRVLALDEADVAAANNLGVALGRLGQAKKALASCERALTFEPNDAVVLLNVAALVQLSATTRDAEAAAFYKRAAVAFHTKQQQDPSRKKGESAARRFRGVCLERQGKLAEAVAEYRFAAALDPANDLARTDLATAEALLRGRQPFENNGGGGGHGGDDDDGPCFFPRPADLEARRRNHADALALTALLAPLDRIIISTKKPPKAKAGPSSSAREIGGLLAARAKSRERPLWRPAAAVGPEGPGFLDMPQVRRSRPATFDSPGLASAWRTRRRRGEAAALFHSTTVFNGEYVPPRPASLDPLGQVERPPPPFVLPRKRASRPPSHQLLKNRAALRRAIAAKIIPEHLARDLGLGACRLCWDRPQAMSDLRSRIPVDQVSQSPEDRCADRRTWRT